MASQNINLFQTKTLQPILTLIERYARTTAIILLSIVFSGGLIVGIAYIVFGQQRDSMERKKQQLLTQVKSNVAKESMVILIRNRISVIDSIMGTQISYAPFITTTMKVIQSFPLTSFSMGDKNSMTISFKVFSIEEAMGIFTTVLDMEKRKEITNPVLQSFTLNEKGIQIGLSYIVVL